MWDSNLCFSKGGWTSSVFGDHNSTKNFGNGHANLWVEFLQSTHEVKGASLAAAAWSIVSEEPTWISLPFRRIENRHIVFVT